MSMQDRKLNRQEFEEAIAAALACGDYPRATHLVAESMAIPVQAFIRRACLRHNPPRDPCDVWQDVMMIIARDIPKLQHAAATRTWVFTIAIREAKRASKLAQQRTDRRPETEELAHAPLDTAAPGVLQGRVTGPFTFACRAEQQEALRALEEETYNALYLYIEGHSWRQIAEILPSEDPNQAVEARARQLKRACERAIAKLRGAE